MSLLKVISWYIKYRDKLKAFIAPKMTYLIILLGNNRKLAIYTGVNIHGL